MSEGQLTKAFLEFTGTGGAKCPGGLFPVQFNPVQLEYCVSSGQMEDERQEKIMNFQSGKQKEVWQAAYEKPQMIEAELRFTLIFDKSLEPEQGVAGEVEGFAAAVLDPFKRNVVFRWGSLRFEGSLRLISGEYTMFSSQGKPLRARISVSICSRGRDSIPKSWTDAAGKIFGV